MLKTNLEPLKAINVGIDNNEGSVKSRDEFGDAYESGLRQPLQMHNSAILVGGASADNSGGRQRLNKIVHLGSKNRKMGRHYH